MEGIKSQWDVYYEDIKEDRKSGYRGEKITMGIENFVKELTQKDDPTDYSSWSKRYDKDTIPNRVKEEVGVKNDQGKSRMDLIDPKWLLSVGDVLGYGAEKYAPDNWKKVGERRYIAAAMRHLLAYMDGNKLDDGPKGSGLPHLSHASTCLMFLHYLDRQWKVEDNVKLHEGQYANTNSAVVHKEIHDYFTP